MCNKCKNVSHAERAQRLIVAVHQCKVTLDVLLLNETFRFSLFGLNKSFFC